MTLRCPQCDCLDVQHVSDNGAQYPQTRVERYECQDCRHEFTKTLIADGGETQ